MTVYHMTLDDKYEDIIKSHENVIVDFFAGWCGPCTEVFAKIEQELKKGKNVKVVKVDMDDHADIGEDLELPGIPYVILYQNGEKKNEFYGRDWPKLKEIMDSV